MRLDLRKDLGRVENRKIAYFLNFFPVLSETFILSEIKNLLNSGLFIEIYALFRSDDDPDSQTEPLIGKTWFLTDHFKAGKITWAHLYMFMHAPRRYIATLLFALSHRNSRSLMRLFLIFFKFHSKCRHSINKNDRQNILLHFLLVMPLTKYILKNPPCHIHAHYLNASVSFALLVSRLCGIPYSVSIHATDIFVSPELPLVKLHNAAFILTCTQYNKKFIIDRYPAVDSDKILVNYHGVDVKRLSPEENGKNESTVLLSIGRLVPKKGFKLLISACQNLKRRGIRFHCFIIGEGDERASLELLTRIKRVNDVITFTGAVPSSKVREYYQKADIFVLPCVIDQNGDRDGIPNVIAEAMAMERPVVSTTVSGIPELVNSGETGILVEPGDVAALEKALTFLIQSPREARRMGKKGRQRVKDVFDREEKTKELIDIFKLKVYQNHAAEQTSRSSG
ncbi:glycosyltransferase family 4 protein [candidate division KSB1 bacterium]|nr:glycosyltransferase family 4 protein [candidate division KSB1 bacterium]